MRFGQVGQWRRRPRQDSYLRHRLRRAVRVGQSGFPVVLSNPSRGRQFGRFATIFSAPRIRLPSSTADIRWRTVGTSRSAIVGSPRSALETVHPSSRAGIISVSLSRVRRP